MSLNQVGSAVRYSSDLLGYNNTECMNSVNDVYQSQNAHQNLEPIIMDIYKRLDKLTLLDDICNRLTAIENRCEVIHSELNKMKIKVDKNRERIERLEYNDAELQDDVNFLHQDKQELFRISRELKEDILEVQTRSMRDNLLFGGITRRLKCGEDGREYEDTEEVIKEFIVKEMDIQENISFERVHRIGRTKNGKPPFIVAKFTSHKQRELVRKKAAVSLKGKDNYSVFEQFPKEIQERRKRLIPKLKAAKRNGKNAKLVVDKLYIEGQLYDQEMEREEQERRAMDFDDDFDERFDRPNNKRQRYGSES